MPSIERTLSALAAGFSRLGPSEALYPVLAVAIVIAALAAWRRPRLALGLTLVYLALASTSINILGEPASAAIGTFLIANCFLASRLAAAPPQPGPAPLRWPTLLILLIAAIGALHGLLRGNPTLAVFGDVYHLAEFAALLLLGQELVWTERQLRDFVCLIVIAVLATSALQTIDAFMDAPYLPVIDELDRSKRLINQNSPLAFTLLLALAAGAGRKAWLPLLGVLVIEGYIIASFTRGLWFETAVSALALVAVLRPPTRFAALKLGAAYAVAAVLMLGVTGTGSSVLHRIQYGFAQLATFSRAEETASRVAKPESVPAPAPAPAPAPLAAAAPEAPLTPMQILASRRMLEHALLLAEIARHPLLGAGLGASYRIPGAAVLGGPKDEVIDYHYVHDLYLASAFRLGVPCFVLLLGLLGGFFWFVLRRFRAQTWSPESGALLAGLIAATVGEAAISFISPVILNHPTAGVIGCTMGMTLAVLRARDRAPESGKSDGRARA